MKRASNAMIDSSETEVSRVDETEFAKCYRSLIAHFSLTPEESSRQLAGILRRIRAPDGEPPDQNEK